MNLDLRLPIGLMFTLFGAMLTIYGALTNGDTKLYEKSLGININLVWGLVLLVFGILVLTLGRRGQMKQEKIKK